MKVRTLVIVLIVSMGMMLSPACNTGKKDTGKSYEIVNSENPGQELDINKYLVKGKINIVDFYSEFCPPCRRISPLLRELNNKSGKIAVIKVDINRPGLSTIDWRSPLARQYKLNSIPHFKIYDKNGKILMEGNPAYSKVLEYLKNEGII